MAFFSEQGRIAQFLSRQSIPNHPLKELFESVFPIGWGRIGVVALALFIPYQHRFCGVVTHDAAEFRRVLQSWDEPGKSSSTAMGPSIKAMGTCWGIQLLICSGLRSRFISRVAAGRSLAASEQGRMEAIA